MAIDQGARNLGFWGWLTHTGLIQGDPNYYTSGQASETEYAHAIQTAISALGSASDPTVSATFYEWLVDMGAVQGDPNYYTSGRAQPGEITNLVNVTSSFFANPTASRTTPTTNPLPSTPTPPGAGDPDTPPDPTADPIATPEPVDYKARVKALYPWLPDNLVAMFASEWSDTGDPTLALATVRASTEYSVAFPGIKRADGSLRMSEMEWFSTKEAYATLFREFGLNDNLFSDRFTELMEGDVSPMELAERLGGAYEMISNNIPEVADAYSSFYGVNGQAALFASFIDPDLGQAILDRRVSVAQVAGEGLARGFDVDATLAGKLVSGGVDQNVARNFFVQAEGQLQTLDDLARRHRDPDDSFDLAEFADANIFGSAEQTRRIRRLLHAEASLFTDQTGSVATGRDGAITGLSAR